MFRSTRPHTFFELHLIGNTTVPSAACRFLHGGAPGAEPATLSTPVRIGSEARDPSRRFVFPRSVCSLVSIPSRGFSFKGDTSWSWDRYFSVCLFLLGGASLGCVDFIFNFKQWGLSCLHPRERFISKLWAPLWWEGKSCQRDLLKGLLDGFLCPSLKCLPRGLETLNSGMR